MSLFRNRPTQRRPQQSSYGRDDYQEPRLFASRGEPQMDPHESYPHHPQPPHDQWDEEEPEYPSQPPQSQQSYRQPSPQRQAQQPPRQQPAPRQQGLWSQARPHYNARVEDMHPRELSFWREERFYDDEVNESGRSSPLRFILVIASLILIAVFGWLAFRWISAPSDANPPILYADPNPYKMRPDHPGGLQVPYQDRLVYNRLGQESPEPAERLLPAPEQPIQQSQSQLQPQSQPQQMAPAQQTQQVPNQQYAPVQQYPQQPGQPVQQTAPQNMGPAAQPVQHAPQPVQQQPATPVAPTTQQKPAPQTIDQIIDDVKSKPETGKKGAATVRSIKVDPRKFRIQVATLASKEMAEKERTRIDSRHKDIARNLASEAQAVEGQAGIYRVVFGNFETREAAMEQCKKFRDHGLSCLVLRPAG